MATKAAICLCRLSLRGRSNVAVMNSIRPYSVSSSDYKFETLTVEKPLDWVFHVQFNRPEKRNAMNRTFWLEIGDCFRRLAQEEDCRSIVVSGEGKMFSAGLDLQGSAETFGRMQSDEDLARKAKFMKEHITEFQNCFTEIEKCPKPVIAAIHGACIGSGVDLICACDVRYSTKDAWFSVKEVDVGLAADIGTLQRLPKIVGNDGLVREWVYTARSIPSDEAVAVGLVSKVYEDKSLLLAAAFDVAILIASKSPVAVQGSKIVMNYSRDHSVQEGLDFVANRNQFMLQSEDLMKSVMASVSKEPAQFSKL